MARPAGGNQTSNQNSVANAFKEWYASLPPITRTVLTGIVGTTFAAGLGVVPYHHLILYWPFVYQKFHIWRIVTTFLADRISLNLVLNMIFFYRDSTDLETQIFAGRKADYTWFLLLSMAMTLKRSLLLSVVMLWSLFSYAMVYGALAGRAYYYLATELPAQGGLDYIRTPQFLYRLLGETPSAGPGTMRSVSGATDLRTRYTSSGARAAPVNRTPGSGHNWGTGRRL
ncbi:DER1-domain-containing protein [Linderina pennispora]|uniref:Derlin n=1 Tax=Linderina pennispora TaxID=61395 RepID=A0A1Y1WB79_9FUNG|nr:DER1-domain-containing protein [Linderina pennispora]ORX70578.1 DER1-domain-containing protein [Linderina pennispora]